MAIPSADTDASSGTGQFVFVSYAHEDADDVYADIEALRNAGVKVYYDEGIHPGHEWHTELADAIEGCSLFLIFLSTHAAASPNCRRELTFALDRNKATLAVHLHGFEIPAGMRLALGDRQAIHRTTLDEGAYHRLLLDAVRSHLEMAPVRGEPDARMRSTVPGRRRRARLIERATWISILLVATVAAFFIGDSVKDTQPTMDGGVIRFAVEPAQGTALYAGYDLPLALSPDGRKLVYVATNAAGIRQLWLHSFDAESATALADTDGAAMPFWSPDSEWVGFFAANSLKKVRLSGGHPQIVASGVSFFGGATWSSSGTIVFPKAPTSGLSRVPANGGVVSLLTEPGDEHGRIGQLWPQFLDDGEHLIYLRIGNPSSIQLTSLAASPSKTLMDFPAGGLSSLGYGSGHVLFVQDGSLFARPFDTRSLAFAGEPVRLIDGVPVSGPGRAPVTVSATGTLAVWPYPIGEPAQLRWLDRQGHRTAAVDTPAQYVGFALSADNARVVASRTDRNGRANLWLRDLARETDAPLTFAGVDFTPLWAPDGQAVAFGAARRGPPDVLVKRIDGAGEERALTDSPMPEFPSSWRSDGQQLVYAAIDPVHRTDLWTVDVDSGRHQRLALNTDFNETHGKLSPDGRFIAFVTDQSGRDEVWLADFPANASHRQVSVRGGRWPAWSPRGDEIFYISDDKQMMAATISATDSTLDVAVPTPLFRIDELVEMHRLVFPTSYAYDVASDGKRFLAALRAHDFDAPPIRVIVNWPGLLEAAKSH